MVLLVTRIPARTGVVVVGLQSEGLANDRMATAASWVPPEDKPDLHRMRGSGFD